MLSGKLSIEKKNLVLAHLVEELSIRSIERITGVNRNTIMTLLVDAGERAQHGHFGEFERLASKITGKIFNVLAIASSDH